MQGQTSTTVNNDYITQCNIIMSNQINEIAKGYSDKIKSINNHYLNQLNELNKLQFGELYISLSNNIRNDYNVNSMKIMNEFLLKKYEIENQWKVHIAHNSNIPQVQSTSVSPITNLQNIVNNIHATQMQNKTNTTTTNEHTFKLTKSENKEKVSTFEFDTVFSKNGMVDFLKIPDKSKIGTNFNVNLILEKNKLRVLQPRAKQVQTIAENALRVKFIDELQNGMIDGTKEHKEKEDECASILLEISGRKSNKRERVDNDNAISENSRIQRQKLQEKKEEDIQDIIKYLTDIIETSNKE